VRLSVTLAVLGLAATLAWSAAAATTTARGGSAKIAIPAVGHFSLTPISVTSKSGKKPRLKVVGAVRATLVVAGGLTADAKHKGRFIGAVALLNRKTTRGTQSAAQGSATFVVVSTSDGQVAAGPTLRDAICQYPVGNSIISSSGFLDNPPGVGIAPFMDANFAASCPGNFGTFDGASAGTSFLNGLVGGTAAPPPPPTSGTFTVAFSHLFGAGPSSSNVCEAVTVDEAGVIGQPGGTFTLTGPGGFSDTNQLIFSPSGTGTGIFVAPTTVLLTSFGTYNETAVITVNGIMITQTGTWTLDTSSDVTTPPCSTP
jgi:hypothetical protein